MDLFIDGVPFPIRHGESLSKEELLEIVMEELAARERVLKEIVCHGEAMSEEAFLSVFDEVEVNFISGDRSELLEEVTSEVVSSLSEAISLLDQASKGPSGLLDNERWVELIDWICRALDELDPFLKDRDLASLSREIKNCYDDQERMGFILETLKTRFTGDDRPLGHSDSDGTTFDQKGDEC